MVVSGDVYSLICCETAVWELVVALVSDVELSATEMLQHPQIQKGEHPSV